MARSALIPTAATFFTALEADNTKEHWQASRAVYDAVVRPGFLAVLAAVTDADPALGFEDWRVYRAANDTRFGAAKGPYKTFIGAVAERADGVGAFVRLDGRGLLVGTGIPQPASDQLPRLREALARDAGADFETAVEAVRATGARVHGGRFEPLKRVPRPYPQDHRHAEFLRWKGVEVTSRGDDENCVVALLRRGDPLHHWLGRHVGRSALSAQERFAPRRQG